MSPLSIYPANPLKITIAMPILRQVRKAPMACAQNSEYFHPEELLARIFEMNASAYVEVINAKATKSSTAQLDDSAVPEGPALSIVVPCYNEELVLSELFHRLKGAAYTVVGDDYEIIFVDDGSRDRTREMIEGFSNSCQQVNGIFLARNHGHQRALSVGLAYSRGARVLAIDADLQDPPEVLQPMYRLMDEGADVVYGQRRVRAGETISKKLSAKVFYRTLRWLTDVNIPVDTGDFRLMSQVVVKHLNAMPEDDRFVRGMVSWLGFRQVPLLYDRAERFAGETKYPFRKMVKLAIDAITGFSIVPLRLATLVAGIVALLSLAMLFYVILQKYLGNVVSGWSSMMVVVLVVSSVQLLAIGIMGEYVGRLYMQSKKRPKYIVERIVTGRAAKDEDRKETKAQQNSQL
jgi:dolichol-phosphate mannosyltransferase